MGNINEEVIWYLEDKMNHQEETEAELDLYIDYQTYGSFDVSCSTYKRVKKKVKRIMRDGY